MDRSAPGPTADPGDSATEATGDTAADPTDTATEATDDAAAEANADALVDELDGFDRLLEVGIGRRSAVAAALVDRGCRVLAVDVAEQSIPDGVAFVRADVRDLAERPDPLTETDPSAPVDIDAVYALRLPAEIQPATVELARGLDAACLFTTLGFEPPVVDAEPRPIANPARTTLHRVR